MKDEQNFAGIESHRPTADGSLLQARFLRPVDTSMALRHLLWQELKLSKLIGGWIPAIASYDRKVKLARHMYVHNQHMKLLYERIEELPGALNENEWMPDLIDEAYERLFGAADEAGFLSSYLFALRRLYAQYDRLLLKLDPILNAPTVDRIKYIFVEREGMLAYLGEQLQFVHADDEEKTLQLAEWNNYIREIWRQFEACVRLPADREAGRPEEEEGGEPANRKAVVWPAAIVTKPAGPLPERAVLEERFPKYENRKPMQSYSDSGMSVLHDSVKQMIYIYATELFAGETLSSLYYAVDRMPLPFYFDLGRHAWDEYRHSQMGMRRLLQMGYTVDQFQWLSGPGRRDVKESFADLYSSLTMTGEACGFKKKRKSAEAFWSFGDAASAVTVEFDLADERRHIDFGVRWGPELYKKANVIVSFQEMAEMARARRLSELDTVPQEEIAKLAKNFPVFCGFHTSELNYGNY